MKRLVLIITGIIIFSSCEKPNTPPVAGFTYSPAYGNTETLFTFDASDSYDIEDETSVLQVHWDWSNDGTWDTEFSSHKVITHQFKELKTYNVVLEVLDTKGQASSIMKAIEIKPILPLVDVVAINEIGENQAFSYCRILKNGGAAIISRGVCWSKNQGPTTAENKTLDGNGIGEFNSVLTG